MAVFIFALDVLQFFINDENSWVCMDYAVTPQYIKILFFAQSLWCLKICMVNIPIDFQII